MKKLLMGTIVLFLFSLSLLFLQTSCSKSNATPLDIPAQLNKIIFLKNWGSTAEIWTANYDGSNATQVPISLPANVIIDLNVTTFGLSISPDGQKIFFTAYNSAGATPITQIYSCDITGANLTPIASGTVGRVHAY